MDTQTNVRGQTDWREFRALRPVSDFYYSTSTDVRVRARALAFIHLPPPSPRASHRVRLPRSPTLGKFFLSRFHPAGSLCALCSLLSASLCRSLPLALSLSLCVSLRVIIDSRRRKLGRAVCPPAYSVDRRMDYLVPRFCYSGTRPTIFRFDWFVPLIQRGNTSPESDGLI